MAWRCPAATISKLYRHGCASSPQSWKLFFSTASSSSSSDDVLLNSVNVYSAMTKRELLTTFLTLSLVSKEALVDLTFNLLSSSLMNYSLLRAPILSGIKKTCYSHFCAGEDLNEASVTLQRLWELGLRGILNYSLEDAMDNSSCDRNLDVFLNTIHQTPLLPPGSVSFSCVKITALCPIPLLERVSNLLRWQHKHADLKLPWKEDVLPLLAPESPTYHVASAPEPLSQEEEKDFQLAKQRLWQICKESQAVGLPLLVDAEYSTVQPAIDYLTYIAALDFNKNGQGMVYGTIQAYLKDSLARLTLAVDEAYERGATLGIKLVRGAYLTRETAMAKLLGVESPIHSCIESTHKSYDTCASFLLERAVSDKANVVLATHNFNSGRAAAAKAEDLGVNKRDGRVEFAQIKGMADGLSLGLVQAGYRVSKYLAFGPVDQVMPYLMRRAEENKGVLSATVADRHGIRKELRRRLLGR